MKLTGRPEPILTRAALVALVSAVLMLLDAFGVPITSEQQEAINQIVMVVAPFVLWFVARGSVTPMSDPRDKDGNPMIRDQWE